MTKSIYVSKINLNESINCLLMEDKEVRTKIFLKMHAFIDYLQAINDVYKKLEDHNSTKKRRLLIVFDDVIVDMESNKKLSAIVTELFLRGRKLNISFIFIS